MSSPSAPTTGLNLAQQEAVNFMHGPCLVLAGAGSGKTRVITHKIGRLIQSGVAAKNIFAITFTNKAAAEMRERARGLIGKAAKDAVICTFHALGVRLLREDGAALGLKANFSILDSDDVNSILKDAGGTVDAATARSWQWTISLWKNQGLNAAAAAAQAGNDSERIVARVMAHYEERLTAYQSVDFDDLISLPLKLLQNHEDVRQKWQAKVGPYPGGRVPGHQRHPVRAAETAGGRQGPGAGPLHRRGRRRPVHLRLARRHARQPEETAGRFPGAQGHQAGAELPLHQRHFAGRQQRDRAQPQALSRKTCGATSARANRCGWSMPTPKNTRPSAPWRASRACAPAA